MYETFYGFLAKPFEAVPDPRFLYASPSHLETISAVLSGIRNRKGLIVITGEVGTGKTTLTHSLLQKLDKRVKTAFVFHTTVTFKDLMRNILHDLEVSFSDKEAPANLWNRLLGYSGQLSAQDGALVIFIDEAQDLWEGVLEELIQRFSVFQSNPFQIVLVGQPELEEKLKSGRLKPLEKIIAVRCQIKALTEEESRKYIDHRLSVAGSGNVSLFTPQAKSLICLHAHGIPRIINVLCDNALLAGYTLSSHTIDDGIIRKVIRHAEGPNSRRILSSSIHSRKPRLFHFSLQRPTRRILLALFALVCLGSFAMLALRYTGQARVRPPSTLTKTYPLQFDSIQKPDHSQQESAIGSGGDSPTLSHEKPAFIEPAPSVSQKVDREEGRKPGEIVIAIAKEKDCLSDLVMKSYGSATLSLLDMILVWNPEITNVNLIKVDERIKMPNITDESLIIRPLDGSYRIHVGTFRSPGESEVFRNEPSLKGREVEIIPAKVAPEETWYRVIIGKFVNEQEALKTIHDLRQKGLLPWLQGISLTRKPG
jgi:general secretion pathway protein A